MRAAGPGRELLPGRIAPGVRYAERMNESPVPSSSRSVGRTVVAGLIVLLAGYVLLKIVIGIALAIALPVLAILAVVALVWAFRVLF
jgi:uncharacterized membrane protein